MDFFKFNDDMPNEAMNPTWEIAALFPKRVIFGIMHLKLKNEG